MAALAGPSPVSRNDRRHRVYTRVVHAARRYVHHLVAALPEQANARRAQASSHGQLCPAAPPVYVPPLQRQPGHALALEVCLRSRIHRWCVPRAVQGAAGAVGEVRAVQAAGRVLALLIARSRLMLTPTIMLRSCAAWARGCGSAATPSSAAARCVAACRTWHAWHRLSMRLRYIVWRAVDSCSPTTGHVTKTMAWLQACGQHDHRHARLCAKRGCHRREAASRLPATRRRLCVSASAHTQTHTPTRGRL